MFVVLLLFDDVIVIFIPCSGAIIAWIVSNDGTVCSKKKDTKQSAIIASNGGGIVAITDPRGKGWRPLLVYSSSSVSDNYDQ